MVSIFKSIIHQWVLYTARTNCYFRHYFFSPELQQLTWLTIDSVYGMTLIIIEPLVTASYWQTQSTWSKTTIATRPSSVLLFTIWSHTRFNVVHCRH